MGRWGSRLFEGDQDRDISGDIDHLFKDHNLNLAELPFEDSDSIRVIQTREKLDDGLGEQILEYCRSKEEGDMDIYGGKYRTIMAGALMMAVGAKIKPEHMQHLRDAVPQVDCNYGYVGPFCDFGFRHAGKVQFLAALDHYGAGSRRDFMTASCNACGKIADDIGAPPKKCGGCKLVWYCDKECQRQDRKKHRRYCQTLEQRSQGKPFVCLNV